MGLAAEGLAVHTDANGLVELTVVLTAAGSNHLPHDGSIRCDFDKLVTGRAKRITIGQAVGLAVGSQFSPTAGMFPTPHHDLGLENEFDKPVGPAQRQQHIAVFENFRFVVVHSLNLATSLQPGVIVIALESPVSDHPSIGADFSDGVEIANTSQPSILFK